MFVVDDFAPSGSQTDIGRLHHEAERLIRAQGNAVGRGRMRPDTSLRPAKPPRGLILSTGEDVPLGPSLRARMLVLELAGGDIDPVALSACQADAAAGRYAVAMAGFIRWLAQHPAILRELRSEVISARDDAQGRPTHRRTPDIVANVIVAMRHLLAFAREVGAMTADEQAWLEDRCLRALQVAASRQAEHQATSDPVARFADLLAGALTFRRAHVVALDGGIPAQPSAWGWRHEPSARDHLAGATWKPYGSRVGWVFEDDPYLEPTAALAAAQPLGRDSGEALAVRLRQERSRPHRACVSPRSSYPIQRKDRAVGPLSAWRA